jgi:hypothetical protein
MFLFGSVYACANGLDRSVTLPQPLNLGSGRTSFQSGDVPVCPYLGLNVGYLCCATQGLTIRGTRMSDTCLTRGSE